MKPVIHPVIWWSGVIFAAGMVISAIIYKMWFQ